MEDSLASGYASADFYRVSYLNIRQANEYIISTFVMILVSHTCS